MGYVNRFFISKTYFLFFIVAIAPGTNANMILFGINIGISADGTIPNKTLIEG